MLRTNLISHTVDTPVGNLTLVADDTHLLACHSSPLMLPHATPLASGNSITRMAARQLDEYFSGHRRRFDTPLRPSGSPFQLATWMRLADIAYGTTLSYSDFASGHAVRASASAIARNPLLIFLPCHRVVRADGSCGLYALGADIKRRLLDLESHFSYNPTQP